MIMISNSGPQIDAIQLAELEAAIGAELPASYRSFLLGNNGGVPTPDTIDIDPAPGGPTDIQVFFGIGRTVESSDLAWNLKIVSERLATQRFLPIACDSGGNFFCLDVRRGGAIVYFDLNSASSQTYEVAPSFNAFLEKIRPWQN